MGPKMFGIESLIGIASSKLADFLKKNNGEKELTLEEINKFLSKHQVKILIGQKEGKTLVKILKTE